MALDLDALMGVALDEARAALAHGDVPIGAVIAKIDTGEIVARRHNERELTNDPTAHAEVLAIRDAAAAIGSWRLRDCVLVSTIEPCPMCAGAAVSARVPVVAFGAADPKAGSFGTLYNFGSDPRLNHTVAVHDRVRAAEAAALVESFFAARRTERANG